MKKMWSVFIFLFIFGFSTMSVGNEWANYYFPDRVGSSWTYQDQDGNELTRYAIEPEEIDGDTYRAFSYDPPLEDWADFEHYIHPYYYQVGEDWIAYFVGTEIENGLKASTMEQAEVMLPIIRQQLFGDIPEGVTVDLGYDIEVNSADYFYLLPTPITYNEEWTALELNVEFTVTMNIQGLPEEIPGGAPTIKTSSNIVEIGKVTGTETVETSAGSFEDCLVIEYQTDEIVQITVSIPVPGLEQPQPEEQKATTVTTLWLAPNVGIVKFRHEHPESDKEKEKFGLEPEGVITLELTDYEIKSSPSETE